jgi:biotin carboxyl carrier protein
LLEEGGIVGEIRVMDVKYRVSSPAKGQVEEYFVEDGMGVEYGQPLVRLSLGRGEA